MKLSTKAIELLNTLNNNVESFEVKDNLKLGTVYLYDHKKLGYKKQQLSMLIKSLKKAGVLIVADNNPFFGKVFVSYHKG
jgi:hypothetical protein